MTHLVALVGGLTGLIGLVGLLDPTALTGLVTSVWRSKGGTVAAIGIRLAFGAVLVVAASGCRFPDVVRFLGVLYLVGAVVIPIIGFDRLNAMVDWWAELPAPTQRVGFIPAIAMGGFLVYAGV